MLLAINIGNTNINFGVFRGNKMIKRFNLSAKDYSFKKLKNNLRQIKIEDAIICSVVPDLTQTVESNLINLLRKQPYITGKNIKVPINNLYRNPKQTGHDRLLNAYAGGILYGAPLIVADFGTAVTFDVVAKNKDYLGGMILPGMNICLQSLSERTALLPKVKLNKPKEFIGRDTKNSILSGIVYGFAALSDGLAEKIKNKIGANAKIVGTGGNIKLISKYCEKFDIIDQHLTLKGLSLIYNQKRNGKS